MNPTCNLYNRPDRSIRKETSVEIRFRQEVVHDPANIGSRESAAQKPGRESAAGRHGLGAIQPRCASFGDTPEKLRLGGADLLKGRGDRRVREIGSDAAFDEFGSKPESAARPQANPVSYEGTREGFVIQISQLLAPVRRAVDRVLGMGFPSEVPLELLPAAGAVGQTIQGGFERIGMGAVTHQCLEGALIDRLAAAKPALEDEGIRKSSECTAIHLETDPASVALRFERRDRRHGPLPVQASAISADSSPSS
jgi:hypothetical protein